MGEIMISAFGIKIDTYTIQEFINHIIADVESGKRAIQVTGINMRQVSMLKTVPGFADYCNASDYINIDGSSVSRFLRLTGHKDVKRVLCADLFYKLLDYANNKGESVYFLGASSDVIKTVCSNIHTKYPNINIVGYHSGFFENELDVVNDIRRCHPTFLFLGMPSPNKERFVTRYKQKMDVAVSFGVGGMFDIIAGKVERAPKFWQKIGLEWFYRAIQNRKHLKRIFYQLIPFVSMLLMEIRCRINNRC